MLSNDFLKKKLSFQENNTTKTGVVLYRVLELLDDLHLVLILYTLFQMPVVKYGTFVNTFCNNCNM